MTVSPKIVNGDCVFNGATGSIVTVADSDKLEQDLDQNTGQLPNLFGFGCSLRPLIGTVDIGGGFTIRALAYRRFARGFAAQLNLQQLYHANERTPSEKLRLIRQLNVDVTSDPRKYNYTIEALSESGISAVIRKTETR